MKQGVALLLCMVFALMLGTIASYISPADTTEETKPTEDTFWESYQVFLDSEQESMREKWRESVKVSERESLEAYRESLDAYNKSTTEAQERIVYVSKSGHKIHKNANCSGMKHSTSMTYKQAIDAGYFKCMNCYG